MKTEPFNNKILIGITLILCFAMVIFEAAQQLFYLKLYNIGPAGVTFTDLFMVQFRKWIIWLIYAIPVWFYIKIIAEKDHLIATDICKIIVVILALLACVLFTMSVVEIIVNDFELTAQKIWSEYFTFYVFQKLPIYLFGYTFLALIFYLYNKNNQLIIQVLKLNQLTKKDLAQFYQQKANQDLETSVLKIKVGNTYKIISIEDIDWVEADDYCVNIHCKDNHAIYSMRSSLKALEKILPDNFLRVHRSAIVNMNDVQEYKTQGSGLIKLKSGEEISVAKSKTKMINDFFQTTQG